MGYSATAVTNLIHPVSSNVIYDGCIVVWPTTRYCDNLALHRSVGLTMCAGLGGE